MSKIIYLEASVDGINWTTITKASLDTVDISGNMQFKLRIENAPIPTTTTTTSTTTTTTTTLAPKRVFTLSASPNGTLIINGGYKPGDIIQLRGLISYLQISNLNGTEKDPIIITNYPGETVLIGNPAWNGSGYANAMAMGNSHYIKMFGETKDKLVFTGSTQDKRTAYSTVYISQLTDNIEVYNWTLINGGTGFVCKTDPTTDPRTYGTGTTLSNFSFHDFEVHNTLHEALYIGHTATYWDLTANAPFYDSPSKMDPTHKYVEPLKLHNVKIYDGYCHDIGYDGIQTAACDNIEIYNNLVERYAAGKVAGHGAGILSGGKNSNALIHDNIIRDGDGEFMYIFGSGLNGKATHVVKNNLMYNNRNNSEGITVRGTDQLQLQLINNTIISVPANLVRINSYFETGAKPPVTMINNILIKPVSGGGIIYDKNYVYLENGATVIEKGDIKFPTLIAAGINTQMESLPTTALKVGVGYQPAS